MTKKEKNDLHEIIDGEGFDYTFRHYSSFDEIKDETFHKLIEDYGKAANNLAKYIGLKGIF